MRLYLGQLVTDGLTSREFFSCTARSGVTNSLSGFRILERLADEGWGDEISSHRTDYTWSIVGVDGVNVARPLTDKGTNAHVLGGNMQPENWFSVWKRMKSRVNDAMQRCKKEIEKKTLEVP